MWFLKKLSNNNSFKLSFYLLIIYTTQPILGKAQNWLSVDSGFNFYPRTFLVDSIQDKLYAMGSFTVAGGSQPVHYAAQYDGVKWDSIPVLNNYYVAYDLITYKGKIIFGSNWLLSWDGNKVDTLNTFTWGDVRGLFIYDNNLVVYGWFDSIGGIKANSIALWDGTSWSALDTTIFDQGITTAIEYNNEIYIGGNFTNFDGSLKRLAHWNGSQWLPVGNGIRGGFASVGSFEIYDGDLYVAGVFRTADGNPGNSIARWDGTQWKDVGSGMTSQNAVINDLQVYNNELYACGNFTAMGDLQIKGMAKWNGNRWCGLGFPNGSASTMAVYHNELYLGGNFNQINGDSLNHVAKWIGGNYTDTCSEATAVNEINGEGFDFSVYPNPATESVTFSVDESLIGSSLTITDITGRELLHSAVQIRNPQFDIRNLSPGIYFVTLENKTGRVTKKLIVAK